MKPRILILHNSYQTAGGEDAVVRSEAHMLTDWGAAVHLHVVANQALKSTWSKVAAALGSVFSFRAYRRTLRMLNEWRPDLVHVHNFFPLLSPSVFYACNTAGIPVVFTLHNFRIVCPTALLMHEGKVTERSIRDGAWWAVRARTFRKSYVGTFFLVLMIEVHKRLGTWQDRVDRFIVLSKFAKRKFADAGLPIRKLIVKPNFVDSARAPAPRHDRSGFLFVGRLSTEKGLQTLLSAAAALRLMGRETGDIRVVGEGEWLCRVRGFGQGVVAVGPLPGPAVRCEMSRATALVLPSTWYEGFPMVLVEAFACGLPVIASRIGALAELVDDGKTGLLFEPGDPDDLAAKLLWVLENPEAVSAMGRAARARYEERYTASHNIVELIDIYRNTVKERRGVAPNW